MTYNQKMAKMTKKSPINYRFLECGRHKLDLKTSEQCLQYKEKKMTCHQNAGPADHHSSAQGPD